MSPSVLFIPNSTCSETSYSDFLDDCLTDAVCIVVHYEIFDIYSKYVLKLRTVTL